MTSHPNYASAVDRVNTVVAHFKARVDGYPLSFPREIQHKTLVRLALGLDVSLSLRTGGGKTLVAAHAPWLVGRGATLLVCPLNTLIAQHVETFAKFMPRHRLYVLTPSNAAEINKLLEQEDIGGPPMIILGHPEKFVNNLLPVLSPRANTRVSLMVVDEAHLVNDWGVDFRPAFMQLSDYTKISGSKMRLLTLSGTTTPLTRELICCGLNLPSSTILVGELDRHDIQINVMEMTTDLPARTPADAGVTGHISTRFQVKILDTLNNHPGKTVLVFCQTKEKCMDYSNVLNEFFHAQGSDITSAAFYRDSQFAMEAILQDFRSTQPSDTCRVLTCTVALGMGFHIPNVIAAFFLRLGSNWAETMQFFSRAHRPPHLSPTSKGYATLCVDLEDFRRKIVHARKLQASYETTEHQELGARLERTTNAQFRLLLDPSSCLHAEINKELAGAGECAPCSPTSRATCCNCDRRWKYKAEVDMAFTVCTMAINDGSGDLQQKNIARKTFEKFMKSVVVSPKDGRGAWKRDIVVFQGTNGVESVTLNVLADNATVTKLLSEAVLKHLRLFRYGIPLATLCAQVAAESGGAKGGLNVSQTRWCMFWFMVNGMLEEAPDASPPPNGWARTTPPKRHVLLSALGQTTAGDNWPVVHINERLGYFE